MGVKVVKDLVHSYIEIDEVLQEIIDTPSFQRLRRVKQLSCSYIFHQPTILAMNTHWELCS